MCYEGVWVPWEIDFAEVNLVKFCKHSCSFKMSRKVVLIYDMRIFTSKEVGILITWSKWDLA